MAQDLRTIFNALHHFRPADARKILQDAVDAGVPVASFEMVGRHPLYIVGLSFSWLMALVLVPFLRPFRPSWLVFTYLVPVIPLFILWDGMVSAFRTYSPEELQALVAELEGADAYEWEIGAEPLGGGPPAPVTYLIGTPRAA